MRPPDKYPPDKTQLGSPNQGAHLHPSHRCITFAFHSPKLQGSFFCLWKFFPDPISSMDHFYLGDFLNKLSLSVWVLALNSFLARTQYRGGWTEAWSDSNGRTPRAVFPATNTLLKLALINLYLLSISNCTYFYSFHPAGVKIMLATGWKYTFAYVSTNKSYPLSPKHAVVVRIRRGHIC